MKLKNLFIAGLLAATAITTTVNAQSYQTAVGARLGWDSGLTAKHFFAPSNAVEGILMFSPRYFKLTGLYEYQQPLPGAPGLDWVLGLGAFLGNTHGYKETNYFLLGIELLGGIEYKFPTAPFTLGLDWKPTINLSNSYHEYWYAGFALSLRYTIK